MKLLRKTILGVALLALLPAAAQAKEHLVIDSVDGDKAVIVFSGETARQAKKDDEVQFWDVVQTSRLSSIKLRYPDGSIVVVGRDTKFTVQPKQAGTQYNQLDWGQVRAQVAPAPETHLKAPRFVIRTKTATMGVRGTDFVAGFDAQSGQASVHTIEGTVDMASDESKVMSWQGTPVTAGHEASFNTASQQPMLSTFTPQVYKEKIKTEQPELVALADRPVESATPPAETKTDVPAATTTAKLEPPESKEPKEVDVNAGLKLLRFRVGAISLLQNVGQGTGVQYTTLSASWNPSLTIWGPFSVVANAAGFLVKNSLTGSSVPVVKVGAFLDIKISAFHLELGPGIESWKTDLAGTLTNGYVMANVVWDFAPGKWIDTIFAGYSSLHSQQYQFSSPDEAVAGVGLRF